MAFIIAAGFTSSKTSILSSTDTTAARLLRGCSKWEDGIDAMSEGATVVREYMGTRMHEFEQTLKSQRTTLASIFASQEQTDDVVEGVVGGMELLHTIVFDRTEGMSGSSPAVSTDLELIAR